MITTAAAAQSRCAILFSSSDFFLEKPTVTLACMLLSELHAGDRSGFAPYVKSLPNRFTVPLYMTREELSLFRGTLSQHVVAGSVTATLSHYMFVLGALQELYSNGIECGIETDLAFDDFRWAMAVVSTRQNNVPSDIQHLALIPAFDMVNHEEGEQTAAIHFGAHASRIVLNAKRDFKQGEELVMSYGSRDATQMVMYSGFVLDTNPKTNVVLPLVLRSQGDALHIARTTLLKSLGIVPRFTVPVSKAKAAAPAENLVAVRTTGVEVGAHYNIPIQGLGLVAAESVALLTKEQILVAMRGIDSSESLEQLFGEEVVARGREGVSRLCRQGLGLIVGGEVNVGVQEHVREEVAVAAQRLRESEELSLKTMISSDQ